MNNRLITLVTAIAVLASLVLTSCGGEDFRIESSFINSGSYAESTNITPVQLSTFRLDSVRTSGYNKAWVGRHTKPIIGDVCSEALVRLTAPSSMAWSQKEKYDSITIEINHTGEYQGDTMKAMTINVHRLAQPLRFAERENAFYNVRTFRDSSSIGSFRFRPRPHSRPHLRYRLDDSFGRELVKFIKDNNYKESGYVANNFDKFLGGIKLTYDDAQNLLAFDASSIVITLHSHIPLMEKVKNTRTLSVSNEYLGFQYNSVWTENTVKPYDELTERYKQVTEDRGGKHSVQFEGLGYYTRVNLSSLESVMSESSYAHIVKATLYIYPEQGSYDKRNFPSLLYMQVVNKGNVVQGDVVDSRGQRVVGLLHYNIYDEKDVYYTADLTYYLNKVLASGYVDKDEGIALMWNAGMMPSDYNFMVFNGHSKNKYYSYLKLYYYYYDKEDR